MMNKATTFETYLESLEISKRLALEKIRKTVHTAAPGAEECICYGIPSFRLNGKMLVAIGCNSKTLRFLSDERWHGGSICRETIWF